MGARNRKSRKQQLLATYLRELKLTSSLVRAIEEEVPVLGGAYFLDIVLRLGGTSSQDS